MKQCLVTLPLQEGSQCCCHFHALSRGRPSQTVVFPPPSASNLKQGSSVEAGSAQILGLCCPPPGQLGLSVGRTKSHPGSMSTALDVLVHMDFRTTPGGYLQPSALD